MFLYDKDGKAYKVPHAIDRKEWIATGKFFEKKPKAIAQTQAKAK